ncbi:hypothetical protein VTJ83DRAFT_2101 [Remersonia thermophila]|uniref:alpha-amylase n=1 Tax=Remersonia thermophila TaxID=72144 RepID=A0ABR4DHT8_9PEZI
MGILHHALLLAAGIDIGNHLVSALSAAEWRKQSIYQVVTDRFARSDLSTTARCSPGDQVYCGGTWRGLISKLDYIQGMGFTSVWISPVVKQIDGNSKDGSSYHGYWAKDIWSLNSAFGTEQDLKDLSSALHSRGMYLMLDIVTNHMAYMGCRDCVDYTQFNPFSSSSYFHPPCPIDYNSQVSVERCWQGSNTVSLPDLRTEDEYVRRIWNQWIEEIVSKYSVDGLRVDSAKHVETSFWPGFSAAARVFLLGEVYHGDPSYVAPYQQYMDGLLDYPSYYWMLRAFQSSNSTMGELVNGINKLRNTAQDLSLYGSFLENHDIERFGSFTRDLSLVKNAIAFTMLKDGIPIVYQGQEHLYSGGKIPHNREALWLSGYRTDSELYQWIAKLNKIRSHVIAQDTRHLTYKSQVVYSDDHTIALRKGHAGFQLISVFTNVGSSTSAIATLSSSATGFGAKEALVDVINCAAFTTDMNGGLSLVLANGLPRVLYPRSRLLDSGICPGLTDTATMTPQPTRTSSAVTASPTTSTAACRFSTVAVTFNVLATTSWGEVVKVTGNTSSLGNWNTNNAPTLSATQYTANNPLWFGTVQLTPGTVIQYKFVRIGASGMVSWESDPNRVLTVPCAATTVSHTWR